MTLPKLLFALGQKGVVLSEGKGGRVRFNPRRPVSDAMKAAIRQHKPDLLELLRGGDLDKDPSRNFDPPAEWFEEQVEAERLGMMEAEEAVSEWGVADATSERTRCKPGQAAL